MADIKLCDGNFELSPAESKNIFEFYKDATVLITGGTGFLGKVLVEKLLRCFGVKRIYLLIRAKNEMNAEQRLVEYFKESIFDRLRKEYKNLWHGRVQAISVDYTIEGLGIDGASLRSVVQQVQVVFNIVASVKFNEPLKEAVTVNIIGTKRVLDLVQQIQQLKAFVHISTLYSNCHLKEIGEKVYRPEISCTKFLNIIDNLDSCMLEKYGQGLLQGMPNTYTLTKRYSEELVTERSQCLYAGIFRPPILMNTYQAPFPGWTDNLYGPAAIAVGAARGFIHCIYGDADKVANLVPVDYCVNALVAVAWDIGQKKQGNVPVYNYIYRENNLTWGQYMAMIPRGFHEPLDKCVWYYSYTIVKRKLLFKVVSSLVHTFPGYLIDFFAEIFGRQRTFAKIYTKIEQLLYTMSYFGLREWRFDNRNITRLSQVLKCQGVQQLEFDLSTVDWDRYFRNYMPGIRKYYLKENDEKLKALQARHSRLKYSHRFLKAFFWTILYWKAFKYCLKVLSKLFQRFVLSK